MNYVGTKEFDDYERKDDLKFRDQCAITAMQAMVDKHVSLFLTEDVIEAIAAHSFSIADEMVNYRKAKQKNDKRVAPNCRRPN